VEGTRDECGRKYAPVKRCHRIKRRGAVRRAKATYDANAGRRLPPAAHVVASNAVRARKAGARQHAVMRGKSIRRRSRLIRPRSPAHEATCVRREVTGGMSAEQQYALGVLSVSRACG